VCEDNFCPDCRLSEYRENRDEFCMNCRGTLLHLLESENETLRQQLEELRSLNQYVRDVPTTNPKKVNSFWI
jgi:uncharacterized damage-inducible protein DinB